MTQCQPASRNATGLLQHRHTVRRPSGTQTQEIFLVLEEIYSFYSEAKRTKKCLLQILSLLQHIYTSYILT